MAANSAPEPPEAPGSSLPAAAPAHPLPFRLLPTTPSSWDPALVNPTLNVRLDGCIVPSEASEQGARISYSHAVVIDDFIEDATRQQLLDFLLGPPPAQPGSAAPKAAAVGEGSTEHERQQKLEQGERQPQPHGSPLQQQQQQQQQPILLPSESERWERRTTDMAGAAPTWGVKQHVLQELMEGRLPALQEVHARLCKLYPECDVAHLPSDAIQLAQQAPQREHQHDVGQQQEEQQQQQEEQPPVKRSKLGSGIPSPANGVGSTNDSSASARGGGQPPVDCACFVANAAVAGDSFQLHVDADPTSFPDGSPWHTAYGDYFNGEPGRPLLVSLLLYLNPEWRREWGAETLLVDGQTDTGVFVAPHPCRAVLFDQDIMHRVSPPSAAAGDRPRFSLVWKLVLLPRRPCQALCLARPEWGPPASIGSAARVDAVKRQLVAEQRRRGTT